MILCGALAAACVASTAHANLLANPSFEDPVTSDGPPFVGFWEAFAGGGAVSLNEAALPLSGAQHLTMNIGDTPNTFAGAFQDVPVVAGQIATFSGWALSLLDDGASNEIRIEWRDSVLDVEVSRTANFAPPALSAAAYTQWSVTVPVPAGADTARAVYAIQSFGGPPTQIVYLDDVSFTVIPEPAAGLLALLGLAPVALRRR